MATKKKPIKIKKSKQGYFSDVAKKSGMTVQQKATQVLKKNSKATPAMKKRAVFAKNAAKWNKKK